MIEYKKITIICLITIFLISSLTTGFSKDITIDNSTSIQETIINSDMNDVIILESGIYTEFKIVVDKNLTITGGDFPENVIIDGKRSGVIFTVKNTSATVKFINITFINGYNLQFGGAIENKAARLYIDNCVFINNTASNNGGALDNAGNNSYRGYLFVNNSVFINNYAWHDGGAITTLYGTTDIYNSYFTQNYAYRDGGAIRGGIYSVTNIFFSIFDNNTAKEWGGAIYFHPGSGQIRNSTISNNYAGDYGGGFLIDGAVTVTGSIIANNSAGAMGGAVFVGEEHPSLPSDAIFNYNLFYGNDAPEGSAIYISQTSSTKINFEYNDWNDDDPNDVIDCNPNYNRDKFIPTHEYKYPKPKINDPIIDTAPGPIIIPNSTGPSPENPLTGLLNNNSGITLALTISNFINEILNGNIGDSVKEAFSLTVTDSEGKVSINGYVIGFIVLIVIAAIVIMGYRRLKN